jgi:ABC-type transport system involved in multi-copper enzyme maturation permease subunit
MSLAAETKTGHQILERINLSDEARPDPSLWRATLGVVRYEFLRSLAPIRLLIWIALITFPTVLVYVNLKIMNGRVPDMYLTLSLMSFLLLPQAVTVLGMLLYIAPIVNAELESQNWIYYVVRPTARQALLLGRYFVAVLWCGSCTSLSSLAISIIAGAMGVVEVHTILLIMLLLCWLSAAAYGALFMTIGVFFQHRAMVYALVYGLLVEAAMGWIPAVINLLTVSYRLRSLLFSGLGSRARDSIIQSEIPWDDNPWKHIAMILLFTGVLLGAALYRVQRSNYRWNTTA